MGKFLIGLVLGAALLELTLRAMAASPWWRVLPAVQAQIDGPDPETGYGHRPNVEGLWLRENRAVVRINAQGLRDRPRATVPPPGTIRIAVAGDSITEALQVDEHDLFTLRAEENLRQRGWPVEVLNFGLSGALPLQQLLFIADRGLPMGIDGAVFTFTAADFLNQMMRDDRVLPAYVDTPSGDLAIGRSYRERRSHRLAETWIGKAFFWSVDNSLVLNALYIRLKQGFLLQQQDPGTRAATASVVGCDAVMPVLSQAEQLWIKGEPLWAARRLDRFLDDVGKVLGGKPAMFLLSGFPLPGPQCVAENGLRARVVAQVKTRLERAGFVFVDLEAAVAQKRRDSGDPARQMSFGKGGDGGGHLNPWGHRIYAEVLTDAIAPWLVAMGRKANSR